MKPPLFMFGSGRCGSTLLQRAINLSPKVTMWGEHHGFLSPLANAYWQLTEMPDVNNYIYGEGAVSPEIVQGKLKDKALDICWVNNFTKPEVENQFRDVVLNLLAKGIDTDSIHWGFKEIRYHKGQRVIWFLKDHFPNCKYIFLLRNPLDTIVSGLLAWHNVDELLNDERLTKEIVRNKIFYWTEKYEYLLGEADNYPDDSLVMKYEDLVSNPEEQIGKVFNLIDEAPPGDLNSVFSKKVAFTRENPNRGALVEFVNNELEAAGETFRRISSFYYS